MAAMSLTWLEGVYNNVRDSLRAFTYTRYYGIYFPPLMLCGALIYNKDAGLIKRSALTSLGVFVFLVLCWFLQVLPNKLDSSSGADMYYMTLGGMRWGELATQGQYIRASVLLSVGVLFGAACILFRKETVYYIGAILFIAAEILYIACYYNRPMDISQFSRVDAGFELITEMDQTVDLEDIYVCDLSTKVNHQIFYQVQFLNFDKHVIPEMPRDDTSPVLLFTNYKLEDAMPEGYYYTWLDDNELVYCRGDIYVEALQALGYELIPAIQE